jgi:Flp pilus assembly protein TadD
MKKFSALMIMVISMSVVFGQSAKVQSAYNYLKNGKLDKAKTAIDEASVNESTSNKAKTWFYLGNIYLNIYMTTNEEYKKLSENALEVAYNAYKKTKELDTKEEFKNELQINLLIAAEQFYNKAVSYFTKDDYANSMTAFLTSKEINESFGGMDSLATYNAAICAEYGKSFKDAETLYTTLIDAKYNQPLIYVSLSNIYKAMGDNDKALSIIQLGRERFPDDFNIIITETNLHLGMGNSAKALENLKIALQKEKTNPTIYFAVGAQYNIIVDDSTKPAEVRNNAFLEAEKSYISAVELDSNYYDANYNLGALYVNKAAEIIQEANLLPLGDKRYDPLKAEADGTLTKAIPYLEKAISLHPDDLNALNSLKEIYARLGQLDKANEIKDRIDQLK